MLKSAIPGTPFSFLGCRCSGANRTGTCASRAINSQLSRTAARVEQRRAAQLAGSIQTKLCQGAYGNSAGSQSYQSWFQPREARDR